MHPLQLGLSLPQSTTMPLLLFLYRNLSAATIQQSSPLWLRFRLTALMALSMTISTSTGSDVGSSSRYAPAQLWNTALRAFVSYVEAASDDNRLGEAAEAISLLVDWVKEVVITRKEDRSGWFEGKEWLSLLDMWVGLGRRVRLCCVCEHTPPAEIICCSLAMQPSLIKPSLL